MFVRVDAVIAGITRPSAPRVGEEFFDTNVGLPIWWDGSDWIDAAGVVR